MKNNKKPYVYVFSIHDVGYLSKYKVFSVIFSILLRCYVNLWIVITCIIFIRLSHALGWNFTYHVCNMYNLNNKPSNYNCLLVLSIYRFIIKKYRSSTYKGLNIFNTLREPHRTPIFYNSKIVLYSNQVQSVASHRITNNRGKYSFYHTTRHAHHTFWI